ncbi:MAG: WG repeat-containing protein [Candidatus Gracilibacteria bacterium]
MKPHEEILGHEERLEKTAKKEKNNTISLATKGVRSKLGKWIGGLALGSFIAGAGVGLAKKETMPENGKYLEVRESHDGLRAVKGKNGLWGFIDRKGEEVTEPQFLKVEDFKDDGSADVVKVDGSKETMMHVQVVEDK